MDDLFPTGVISFWTIWTNLHIGSLPIIFHVQGIAPSNKGLLSFFIL